MAKPRIRSIGNWALWLSLGTFIFYFLNVLIGGPLKSKPWMSDLWEMLTLFVAVIFFVAGTICREIEANRDQAEPENTD